MTKPPVDIRSTNRPFGGTPIWATLPWTTSLRMGSTDWYSAWRKRVDNRPRPRTRKIRPCSSFPCATRFRRILQRATIGAARLSQLRSAIVERTHGRFFVVVKLNGAHARLPLAHRKYLNGKTMTYDGAAHIRRAGYHEWQAALPIARKVVLYADQERDLRGYLIYRPTARQRVYLGIFAIDNIAADGQFRLVERVAEAV